MTSAGMNWAVLLLAVAATAAIVWMVLYEHARVKERLVALASITESLHRRRQALEDAQPMGCGHPTALRVLALVERPGSPPGNQWGCQLCIARRRIAELEAGSRKERGDGA